MNLKVLSLAGLGVLGTGAVGAGGIAMSVGGGQGSEETTKTPSVPTVSQRLLGSDYTYNPPKLTNHNTLVQSCTENLLNKTGPDNSKLYGCGVAKLDTYDSGEQFKNKNETVNYLNFSSEIFIRKENGGWRINTRIDNRSSGALIYQHLLTHYKKESNNELIADESFIIDVEYEDAFSAIKDIALPNSNEKIVSVGSELLTIKLPGKTNPWYHKNNYLTGNSWGGSSHGLNIIYKETKTWSGIWIEESSESPQGIFQDIEVFIKDMSYSQVFCKSGPCGKGERNKIYKAKASDTNFAVPTVWSEAFKTTTTGIGRNEHGLLTHQAGPTQSLLDFVKDSQGKWVDANNFCKVEDESKIDDNKLNELKLYCSKLNA